MGYVPNTGFLNQRIVPRETPLAEGHPYDR